MLKSRQNARGLILAYDPAAAVAHLRAADPALAALIDRQGEFALQLRPARTLFEALLRAIVYQQLHGRAAEAIHGRAVAEMRRHGAVSPVTLTTIEDAPLRAAGLSANKLRSIRDLAAKCLAGTVPTLAQAGKMEEAELIERLTAVRGIGPWTVHMLLIFNLGRGDVLPTGDYAVRLAFQRLYRKRRPPTPAQMLSHARRWQPYRSIASWYLWRSLDVRLPE